jgi:AraC-like DNA-binding protein
LPSTLNPIRQRLRDVSRAAKRDRWRRGELAAFGNLQREIPQLFVRAMAAASASADANPVRRRDQAVERAKAYISEFQNWPLTVGHLCEATGLSERTLQYAFVEHFGVTPKIYLKAFCLNKVRRELKRASPRDAKISEIVSRWGFWHMGQFAADYREQFGELPSQTLASANVVG